MASKTLCPITRTQFANNAKPIPVSVAGTVLSGAVKQFSTGSMGYFCNGKVTVVIDGVPCVCQVSCNVTIVGSKELSQTDSTAAA